MLDLNLSTLSAVTDHALQAAADHPRWVNAINRAVAELVSNPYLERQDGHLLICSPSGKLYSANGTCTCEAFEHGKPCWHRAAARLVRLHDEKHAQAAIVADLKARQAEAQRLLDECFA